MKFEDMLTGGHPNSLGNTVKVVEAVLKDTNLFDELFNCYFSDDEVVRLRVSNAMKRIAREKPELVAGYLDRFIGEISQIDQSSTRWTLSQLFLLLEQYMDESSKTRATEIMKKNLDTSTDWIVQNTTIETLTLWAQGNEDLKSWLVPRLENFSKSPLKSVANRSRKALATLSN